MLMWQKRNGYLSFHLGLQQTIIDNDRATFSNGGNAERDLSASLTLQQVIYSEAAWSNISAQELLQKSRESDLLTTELDVIEAATLAYINGLRAKSLIEIEASNLRLTEANLKRAKRRVVAVCGKEIRNLPLAKPRS